MRREKEAYGKEEGLQTGNGVRQIFGADRLEPLTRDRIAFFHGHTGVFSKHLRPSSPTPSEESEKVIFADGMGSRRRVHSCLTSFN